MVNAVVKGHTYFHVWAAQYVKAMYIPYMGMCGTAYGRIYTVFFCNDNCNDSSVLWKISCTEGTEIHWINFKEFNDFHFPLKLLYKKTT